MRIAYDLRYAADRYTGIGTHAFALLKALLQLPGEERYAVLWNPRLGHRRYDFEGIARHPRVEWTEASHPEVRPDGLIGVGNWLRRVGPDAYLSPFYLSPIGAPCPVLLTMHDVWPLRLPEGLSPIRHWLYRASLRRARNVAALLTSSEFSRREIVELLSMPPERVHAVRLGVPPRTPPGSVRRPAGLTDRPFALVVGDNRPRKNLRTLLRAWSQLGASPPLELISAGPSDPRYPSFEALARETGARSVQSLGWQSEGELDWLYTHASLALFPSVYEGFGFPLLEAFDRGVATVTSDIAVLREIGDGATRFVAAEDPEAWAREISRLASDHAERRRLAGLGRERAGRLGYDETARRTLEIVHGVVGGAHGPVGAATRDAARSAGT